MTDSITPALTPEEWKSHREHQAVPGYDHGDPAENWRDVALANDELPDDDRRKITRARVEAIRIAADYWCPRDGDSQAWDEYKQVQQTIRAFADSLAAILPPE